MARFDLSRQRKKSLRAAAVAAFAVALTGLAIAPQVCLAQGGGGIPGGGGAGGGGSTIGTGATSGVAVDASGVLQRVMVNDPALAPRAAC
jgi:hypothetical protein